MPDPHFDRSPPRRRKARFTLTLLGFAASLASATEMRLHQFDVLLDGKLIGAHRFEIRRGDDGSESVLSDARFDVKFLGITAYRYRHQAREQWQDGCLTQLEASTSDNGKALVVRGARGQDGFQLERPAGAAKRVACVAAYPYWDRQRLLRQRELLNPQTGQFDAVTFEDLGEEAIDVQGRISTARRHRLRGPGHSIDLWYAADGQWLQLVTQARGERELRYRLRP
jgi:hypothetical protein